MPNTIARKTFKVQFEITVEMDEIEEEHLRSPLAKRGALFLRRLQQALLRDEAALLELMRSRLAVKLQEYTSYLLAQDDRPSLVRVAQTLDENDRRFFRLNRQDLDDLTHPLRISCFSMQLQDSCIEEKLTPAKSIPEAPGWRQVWRDLLLGSPAGRMLKKMFLPTTHVQVYPQPEISHYLLLQYMTQEIDGVHIEGRCTCDKPFEVCGEDQSQALDQVWAAFQEHFRKYQPIG